MRPCFCCRFCYKFIRWRIHGAESDIVFDCFIKDERILTDDSNPAPIRIYLKFFQRLIIYVDAPLLWLIESQKQADDSRFSGSGLSDNGRRFTLGYVEIDIYKCGFTVIIIAHRLSTIRGADQIVVLRDGRVAEKGQENGLIKKRGEYYKLANAITLDS